MNSQTRSILTWTAYPFVMIVSLILYYSLISYGVSLPLSSFIASIIGGLGLITLLEIILPYRKKWLPNRNEIKTDIVFMLLIQVALPKFLTIFTTVYYQSHIKPHTKPLPSISHLGASKSDLMVFLLFCKDFISCETLVRKPLRVLSLGLFFSLTLRV